MSLGSLTDGGQPASLPPSGAAGGDLSGTYPNPSVTDDSHAHTAATLPATIVYDGDAAGGDLSGTYPNPSVVDDSHAHTASTLPAISVPVASVLAADGTNSTATMASTGLSVPVTLNRKYKFELELHFSESVAAEGLAVDFGGGTAAATNFRASGILSDAGADTFGSGNTVNALATDMIAPTVDDGILLVKGCFEPSSSGTFIPRYAQAAHAVGTLTIRRGSSLIIWDVT